MKLTIDVQGLNEAIGQLQGFSDRRMRGALATALTRTGNEVKAAWQGQLRDTFDKPTPATVGAVGPVRQATADRLQAEVFIKDQSRQGGTAPAEWLDAEVTGGARRLKKFERALQAQGSMPPGHYAVPGPGAKLDAYGNVSRSTIVQVIAQLGSKYSPGYARVISASAEKRRAKAVASGRAYIAIQQRQGQLAPGVYLRKGRGLVAVFYFVRSATYRPRLDLMRTATEVVTAQLERHVRRAIDENVQAVMRKSGGG
jgi:hypothetical protein